MPPGPKKRRARKQQQQQQQLIMKKKEEEEEEEEEEEIPLPKREVGKVLSLQVPMADCDDNLSLKPEETMEAQKNINVEESKKVDHKEEKEKEKEVIESQNINIDMEEVSKVNQEGEKVEAEAADIQPQKFNDAELRVDQKEEEEEEEEEEVMGDQNIDDVEEVNKIDQQEEEKKSKDSETSDYSANADGRYSDLIQETEVSEVEIINASKIASSASLEYITMNQSQLSDTETKPESEVCSELEAVVLSELESKDEVVSELEPVVVCEPEVIQVALVSVDVESEPETKSRFSSEIGPITIDPVHDADLQKEMKFTEVDTVNSVDVEPQLGTEVSMESKSLADADSIAEREEIAEAKIELNKLSENTPEQEQPEGVAIVDILEKQELDQALEPPKEETKNTFDISVIEKHVEVSAKTEEGIAASTSPDAQECSGEVFSFVQEIPLSRIEHEYIPLKSQENLAREEQVVSFLDEEQKEESEASLLVKETEASPLVEEGLSLEVVEKVTEHSSANVAESEDGLIDESLMSEQQTVDDAALSMIVEVGSANTDSDLQDLEDDRASVAETEDRLIEESPMSEQDKEDDVALSMTSELDSACTEIEDGQHPSIANVAESEDGQIEESPMSEQDREDDVALSMIVEVGSVYTDSDLQELEDGRHPPIGMEVGSFDDQDYISRPTSPDMDYVCLKEQDIGDNPYIEQEQFSEEKFGVHQEKVVSESVDNFEPAEAGETIVKGSLNPNIMEEVIVSTTSDDSATTNSCDDSGKLGNTTYTSLENGDNKNQKNLGNGHSNDDISDTARVDSVFSNVNEIGGELKATEEILPAIQNEEEVKVEEKETSIFNGKWKQAAILPEEYIEAWDEKREIVNIVTPIVDDNHPLPIKSEGELENGIDASTEKGAIESTIDESISRTVPNHKQQTVKFTNEKNAGQSDGVGTLAQRSNWFGCCGMLDLIISKDR